LITICGKTDTAYLDYDIFLFVTEDNPLSGPDLLMDEVDPGYHLCHRVFHLQNQQLDDLLKSFLPGFTPFPGFLPGYLQSPRG
jgi:hypothetical protein